MAVSKRTRFEVLRRDSHTCRYCGRSAHEVKLTVDHVLPTALGGTDDPSNLVAACHDCNAGKASTGPGEHLVEQVNEDAIRWAAARQRAILRAKDARDEQARLTAPFWEEWMLWDKESEYLPGDWESAVAGWLAAGLTMPQLIEALDIALSKRHVKAREVFRYTGGIVRNWIADLDRLTAEELAKGAGNGEN